MSTYDPQWLDRMYNNRALVPEHAEHLKRWTADSADAMRTQQRELDVRYGGGPSEHLDIFPAQQADAPVLFFIHGGWWRSLDKRDFSYIAPPFTRAGACVVVPNYALCPTVTVPEIVMQMVRALAWTWRNIGRHGGDRSRIVVAGWSAGGHLATMMLSCVWPAFAPDLPPDLVKRALSVSGVFDLEPIRQTPFLKADLQLTPQDAGKASPALLPPPRQGTLAAVSGADESEEFVRQNRLIRQAWGKDVVTVCETLPGLNHFSIIESMAQPGQRLYDLALGLLRE